MPRVVMARAPGCMDGGWQCHPFPYLLLRFELVPATMFIPPSKQDNLQRASGLQLAGSETFTAYSMHREISWGLLGPGKKNGCEGRKELASPICVPSFCRKSVHPGLDVCLVIG